MIGVFTLISRSHQCSDWPEAERLLGNIKFALISQQNVGHDDNCFGNIFGNIFVDDTVTCCCRSKSYIPFTVIGVDRIGLPVCIRLVTVCITDSITGNPPCAEEHANFSGIDLLDRGISCSHLRINIAFCVPVRQTLQCTSGCIGVGSICYVSVIIF